MRLWRNLAHESWPQVEECKLSMFIHLQTWQNHFFVLPWWLWQERPAPVLQLLPPRGDVSLPLPGNVHRQWQINITSIKNIRQWMMAYRSCQVWSRKHEQVLFLLFLLFLFLLFLLFFFFVVVGGCCCCCCCCCCSLPQCPDTFPFASGWCRRIIVIDFSLTFLTLCATLPSSNILERRCQVPWLRWVCPPCFGAAVSSEALRLQDHPDGTTTMLMWVRKNGSFLDISWPSVTLTWTALCMPPVY